MDTKKCSKCGEVKPIGDFCKCKRYKDGHQCACKECAKQYYEENKERITEWHKLYYEENNKTIAEQHKQYYEENKEKIAEKGKQYRDMRAEPFRDEFFKQLEEDDQVLRKLREENEKKWAQYKIRAV